MKSPFYLGLCAVVFMSHSAFAGFQWVPPKSNPTARPTASSVAVQPTTPAEDMINHIRSGSALPVSGHNVAVPPPAPVQPLVIMPDNAPQSARRMQQSATPPPVSASTMPAPVMPAPQMMTGNAMPMPTPPAVGSSAPIMHEPIVVQERLAPLMQQPQSLPHPTVAMHPSHYVAPMAPQVTSPREPVLGFGDQLPLALALSEIVPPSYSYAFAGNVNPATPISWDGQGRGWDVVLAETLAPHGLMPRIQGRHVTIAKGTMSAPPVIRVQHTAMPIENMRAPAPPLNSGYVPPVSSGEPFSQNYEPILLTPTAPQ